MGIGPIWESHSLTPSSSLAKQLMGYSRLGGGERGEIALAQGLILVNIVSL